MTWTNNHYDNYYGQANVQFTERMRLFYSSAAVQDQYGKNVIINTCTFTNNTSAAIAYDGADYKSSSFPTQPDGFNRGNGAGAIVTGGTITFNTCKFIGSTAANNGGGLYIDESYVDSTLTPVDVKLNNCTFENNQATEGGALYATLDRKFYKGKNWRTYAWLDATASLDTNVDHQKVIITITNCNFNTAKDDVYINGATTSFAGVNTFFGDLKQQRGYATSATRYGMFSTVMTLKAGGEMVFTGTDPNQVVDVDMDGGAGGTGDAVNKVTFDKGYGKDVTVKGRIWGVEEVNFNGLGIANFTNDGRLTTATSTNNLDGLKNVNVRVADDLAGSENGFAPVFSAVTLASGVDFTAAEYDGITFMVEGAKNDTNRDQITFGKGLTGVTSSFAGAGAVSNVKMVKDASDNVMNYLFDYKPSATATAYTYRLGYDKNDNKKLTFAVVADNHHDKAYVNNNRGLFVNSAYNFAGNEVLDGGATCGGLLGQTEFTSLRLAGKKFGTSNGIDQYHCPFDKYSAAYGTYVFLTGGSYTQNQYGYGSYLQVCNDQRYGLSYVESAGASTASAIIVTDPIRISNTAVNPAGPGEVPGSAAKTRLDAGVNGTTNMTNNVLFGGSNVQASNGTAGLKAYLVKKDSTGATIYTVCTAAQLSSHVDVMSTINAAGIVSGSNINVKADGVTVESPGCNLSVGTGKAKYFASSVATTPGGSWGQLIGGNYICGGYDVASSPGTYTVTVNGGSKVTIDGTANGVTVRGFAVGGSKVGSKNDSKALNVTLNGGSTFSIASGTFSKDVAAGSLLEGQSSKLKTMNDTILTITGGTFNGNIYGGNLGYKLGANDLVASDDLWHTADTNLEFIVPGTAGTLNINGHILGGSADKGRVDGNARIIFSGNNTSGGLTFGTSSMISGDSMHAGWWGGTHTSYVAEDVNKKRYLEFGKGTAGSEFIGEFGVCGIVNIDELSFKGASRVTFTNTALDFHDITTWNFNYWGSTQSQMTYGGDIEFKEDVLNVTGLDTLAVGDSWKMVSNIASWNWLYEDTKQFSAVTLNGSTASYAGGVWTSLDNKYKLTLADGADGGILVQRIA